MLPQLHEAYWDARFRAWKKDVSCTTFQTRPEIYQYLHDNNVVEDELDYLEFGVFEGKSMRWWTEHIKTGSARFVGFDTFTGLPDSWEGYEAGHFNVAGNYPDIQDDRLSFVKGLFHETLPGFLNSFERRGQLIIHNDSDLYGSTIFVLMQLLPILKAGDLIVFDELFYVTSEFRALCDALEGFPFSYEVVSGTHDFCVTALKIT